MLTGIVQDVRCGVRVLRREPGYSAVAVLTMALGIGATTTLFSVAYGVLLKPLPWPEPDRLVRLEETRGGNRGRIPWTISNGTYLAWSDQPSTIEAIGAFGGVSSSMTLTIDGAADRVRIGSVSPSLLTVLRARPALGRLFVEEDGASAQPGVMILGFGLWQQRFGGRADIIGRAAQLDNRPVTIVGVMPRNFAFPDREAQAWTPRKVIPVAGEAAGQKVLTVQIFSVLARLRAGVTAEQAAAEATSRARGAPDIGQAALSLFGSHGEVAVRAAPARDVLTAEIRPAIAIFLAAVALLFVTATASAVSVQLARAARRRHEMAIRAAIGAGAVRLTRQWLVESAMVGASGGLGGVLLAAILHRVLPTVLPADFPRVNEVTLDWRMLLFAVGITLLASLVCGLLPSRQARRVNLVESLSEDGTAPAGATLRTPAARTRFVIMAGQIAIACLLLVGAGLLARSFVALVQADRGYDPSNLLTAQLPLPPKSTFASYAGFLDNVRQRVLAVPGVTHVAFGNALPFVTTGGFQGLSLPSPANPGVRVPVQTIRRTVSPEYFAALRLRIVQGRALSDTDTATSPRVVVVNRSFAAQYLGDRPVGMHLDVNLFGLRGWEVVGVVEDVQQGGMSNAPPSPFGGVLDPQQPEMYLSYRQLDFVQSELILLIRTSADPLAVAPALRAIVRDEDPTLALESVMTLEDRVMTSLARPRTYALLLGGFAVCAVTIAGVGLFGVLSYITAQRTREIGVRTALGARPRDIIGLVVRQAMVMTAGGIAVGLAAAFFVVQSLSKILYGVSPRDPWSFLAVPIVLAAVAAAACAVPARKAARLDPLRALRS